MTRMKRRGSASVLAAVMIVGGTAAALATSAPQDAVAYAGQTEDTATQTTRVSQYATDVEWWTAEAYEVYMEEERAALSQMVAAGDWDYTQTDGWFQWTQERMDETMAVHAYILGELRRGVRVSRTVSGTEEIGIQLMLSVPEDDVWSTAQEEFDARTREMGR